MTLRALWAAPVRSKNGDPGWPCSCLRGTSSASTAASRFSAAATSWLVGGTATGMLLSMAASLIAATRPPPSLGVVAGAPAHRLRRHASFCTFSLPPSLPSPCLRLGN